MITHMCSYCGGRQVESHETGFFTSAVINNPPNFNAVNDKARVLCDFCYARVFDNVLGPPRYRYRFDSGAWIREPWLREV